MQKHVITLTGLPGAGKSSTADRVAELLGYRRFSSGDFMRAIAKRHDMSLDDMVKEAQGDQTYDQEVDEMVRQTGAKDDIVIDSRLAFHWIPSSFKVFLRLDPHIAAERTFVHIREVGREQQTAESVEEVYQKLVARIAADSERYQKLYGVDYTDERQFDLVVDTGRFPLEEVVQQIITTYKEWLAN